MYALYNIDEVCFFGHLDADTLLIAISLGGVDEVISCI